MASGGLGCEVFIWDLEAAMTPIARASHEGAEEGARDGSLTAGTVPVSDRSTVAKNDLTAHPAIPQGYAPIPAKGHKESIYALSVNDAGTTLVSGGTEKVCGFSCAVYTATLRQINPWPRMFAMMIFLSSPPEICEFAKTSAFDF